MLTAPAVVGSASAADQAYRLGAQDRLRIHVYEWPALTGEFTVGADEQISLPVVGDIRVTGLQPSELAREISGRLKAKATLTEPPDTAVGVAQYRPFYVIGGVERSGEYAYRPGMIVLTAVSIAGGAYRRPEVSGWASERDALSAGGEIQLHELRRQELLAKELRLKAEIAQAAEFPAPPAALSPAAAGFLAEERGIFAAYRERLRNETTALTQTAVLHRDEIETLKSQREAAEKQRASVQRELIDVRDLIGRGLAPTSRILPIERTVAQIEREQKELDTLVLRARQQINIANRMIATARDDRITTASTELVGVQAQIRETEERIATARRVLQESALYATGTARTADGDAAPVFTFSIVRVEAGIASEIEAFETTVMQPGDILKVQLRYRDAGSRQVARTENGAVARR
ncbi:polysaccharide biosynthesis/export family protein [Methylorubrum salsuginis]|uniref:polysaccharide biosynthesis/export family protein n=1 Tax=Methylorubrum salsuginis TaxID=414703 RepID=UPI0013F4DA64|nr:polysaccharide biosynthesis/export family protein [Methylorubrum salsuginis]